MSPEEAFAVTSGLWIMSTFIGEPHKERLRPVLDESAELTLVLTDSESEKSSDRSCMLFDDFLRVISDCIDFWRASSQDVL